MATEEDLEELRRSVLEKVEQDIARYGWHLVLIPGDEEPGFLFTIGLWQSYQHPEILLFAPAQDPAGMAGRVQAVAERIGRGERFAPGSRDGEVFGDFPGAFREVQEVWYPYFIGTAMAFYESVDFPVVQLFWPDADSRFPWEEGFASDLLPLQPLLYETVVNLANLPPGLLRELSESQEIESVSLSADDVFVDLEDEAAAGLLDDWRWLVGDEAEVFRITVFGDVFTQTPDGHIHRLDTGRASYQHVAGGVDEWMEAAERHGSDWFHLMVLLDLREAGSIPGEGQVYGWRQPPMLGGLEAAENVDVVPVAAHIAQLGKTAEAIKDLPPGTAVQGVNSEPT